MKLTKTQLKQIVKEELGEYTMATNAVEEALEAVLPTIKEAYNSLADSESQAQFEELLLENIKSYVERWRAERGESL